MSNAVGKLSRPGIFLFSEFVIIVLGVVVALAFDNWNSSRQDEKTRSHLIRSLLSDLHEDRNDYEEFVSGSAMRWEAAKLIGRMASDKASLTPDDYGKAREALYQLGRTSRLETVESTFREMISLGSGSTIGDRSLRIRISHYYGLAQDRYDINEMIRPGILRYRASLEEVGVSYVDREFLDVDAVMQSDKALAIIRELGVWAKGAVELPKDLQAENAELIAALEEMAR